MLSVNTSYNQDNHVFIIKVKFIDRIHTKELENGKNMFWIFLNIISAAMSILMF